MEPEIYRFRLKKNHIAIVRDLEPKKILGYLYQDSIFDEDDMEEVRAERTRKKQAVLLLTLLDRKGGEGLESLVNAFQETQPHLARILKTPISNEITEWTTKGSIQVGGSNMEEVTNMVKNMWSSSGAVEHQQDPSPYLQCDNSQQSIMDNDEITQPQPQSHRFVQTTNFHLISPIYRPHLLESVYKMTSSPRGLAVIVNINKFEPVPDKVEKGEKLDEREGSEHDVKDFCRLFEGLDFQIELLRDKTEKELMEELSCISKRDFSQIDCFVLCIMSHGKEDFFYCYDGGKVKISKIRNMFNNTHCETLCRKPKLFFIQACRGELKDFGRLVSDAPSEHSEKENAETETDRPTSKLKKLRGPKGPSTSENADILMAYSSVEGYTSYRNTGTGSRFIRSIVDKFREYAAVEDVMSMLTRVINQVHKDGDLGSKQVPKPETTLTKKVFFWPGVRFRIN